MEHTILDPDTFAYSMVDLLLAKIGYVADKRMSIIRMLGTRVSVKGLGAQCIARVYSTRSQKAKDKEDVAGSMHASLSCVGGNADDEHPAEACFCIRRATSAA